ncbi:MAG: DUF5343 domain-containing protein [Chloroflexi bacterium]|nr:DUF5343 domain-containing protein [Chloroflexota bacterium]
MADKHPYVLSTLHLTQLIEQLRNSFPQSLVVNAEMLQKLGIAPNNEGYVINTVRYLGIIDENGKKTEATGTAFSKHENNEFALEFSKMVQSAYKELFDLYGDNSWTLDKSKLISFFRGADHTGANVGQRQATTFRALARLSGRLEGVSEEIKNTPKSKTSTLKTSKTTFEKKEKLSKDTSKSIGKSRKSERDFGLTVRVEINLPAGADKETYDKIFQSLRENILNAD